MDKNQNMELSILNQNKPDFIRSDSNSSDGVILRNRNSNNESVENLNGKSDNGVTFRTKPNSNLGLDNPSFVNDENDLNLENKDNIQVENDEFESIFNSPKRDSEELRPWDRFITLPPPDEDETLDGEWINVFIKWLKLFAYFFTFVVTLGFAVISKSIILLMTSMIRVNRTIPICNDNIYDVHPPLDRDKRYAAIYRDSDPERIAWLWCLFFAMITPDVFALGRSARICYFKIYKVPLLSTFLTVFTAETLHSIGISLLMFLILPTVDAIKGAMMTNALCLVPGVLLLFTKNSHKSRMYWMVTLGATVCQLTGLVLWPLVVYDESNKFWYLPVALLLVSFSWWENFIDPSSENRFIKRLWIARQDLAKSRYFTYIIISIWKIAVIFSLMVTIEYINDGTKAVESTFKNFSSGFRNHEIEIVRDKRNLEYQATIEGETHKMTVGDPMIPLWVLLIHCSATYLCYAVAKFSCKICIQGISFAIPVNLAVPVTVSFLWAVISASAQDKCEVCKMFKGFQYIFWYTQETDVFTYNVNAYNYISTFMWIISLASQIWISIHVWFSTSERLASTEKLFITPMYSSVIIDQSLAMNRRRLNLTDDVIKKDVETVSINVEHVDQEMNDNNNTNHYYESVSETLPTSPLPIGHNPDETVTIFVCATMWHENKEEMIQMLKAVMRLDADQCARRHAREHFGVVQDYYDIEVNIFFDDAYDQGETDDEDDRLVNRFVKQLIETMDEAATNVHEIPIVLKRPNVVPTPYGGKLEWTLPGQNKLVAHLKDKILIRHRKRWSQCMYMYYLLGHRIAEREIDEYRKETIAMNTFILALDGDINFRPHALHLVVDLMKKNKKLGAACGRIHPIGSGPMVWYQKFEYAIGHWLQKATEHVFGCVLCSPGCFSLFRARAVMDDSVMNKYTTKPSEAIHYVQYDQGEDRWLCTLLLQKGWRIEYCAASDSYTHAPEGFGEFYTQRRRWAPSTMANIMDLLSDYKRTVECNTDISKPYIIYQAMLMVGTILSPGTIFLMVVGAMNTVIGLTSDIALICNIVPILLFAIVCLTVKDNNHIIFVATILSTLYALLMLAVLVGTGIEISEKGILTPNSIFFVSMIGSFIVAAIIHPQEFACVIPLFLYMLLIPSMYLLLTIYSVTNMHIVSWGTREVKSKLTAKEQAMEKQKAEEEAAAKSKKKNVLGFLDFSKLGSKSGLFTCMCCSNTKSEEESAKLTEIREQLNKVNENVGNLKASVDNLEPHRARTSVYRRQSSLKDKRFVERSDSLSTIMGGQTDEEDEELSESERRSTTDERPRTPSLADSVSANKPKWVRDKTFRKYPIVPLTPKELQFWKDFIPKYLLPLDENLKEQERIANDLKELRNRAVFAFGIINTIFILFVFLLQMHTDVFGIIIPAGIEGYNKTYIEAEDRYELTPIPKYIRMDPIGLVLVVFFGAILFVQCIGMFMHRFGTLAHLLAFTTIDFCTNKNEPEDDDTLINKNAVKIIKNEFRKVKDMDEENANLPMNRRQSMFPKPPQELDLDEVFRKRILSITPESLGNTDQKFDPKLKRLSTFKAMVKRRDTIMEERRKMSTISADQNDSTIVSNKRPNSLVVPKHSYELPNNSSSSRGQPRANSLRNSNNTDSNL